MEHSSATVRRTNEWSEEETRIRKAMVMVMGTVTVMVMVVVMVMGEKIALELTVQCSFVGELGVVPISTCRERQALFVHRH